MHKIFIQVHKWICKSENEKERQPDRVASKRNSNKFKVCHTCKEPFSLMVDALQHHRQHSTPKH